MYHIRTVYVPYTYRYIYKLFNKLITYVQPYYLILLDTIVVDDDIESKIEINANDPSSKYAIHQ